MHIIKINYEVNDVAFKTYIDEGKVNTIQMIMKKSKM